MVNMFAGMLITDLVCNKIKPAPGIGWEIAAAVPTIAIISTINNTLLKERYKRFLRTDKSK
jgi:hypothetical protein